MAQVTFSNGVTVEFNRTPTQGEIEAVAMNLGITKPTTRQKFDEALMGGFQSMLKFGTGVARVGTAVNAGLDPFRTLQDYSTASQKLQEKTGIETGQFVPGSEKAKQFNEQFVTPKNKYQAGGQLAGDIGLFLLEAPLTGISPLSRLAIAPVIDTAMQVTQDVGAGTTDKNTLWRNALLTAGTSIMAGVFMPKNPKWSNMARSGLLTGYVADVATGLTGARGEDRTGLSSLIPGAGTAIGGGIGIATGGLTRFSRYGKEQATIEKRISALEQLERDNQRVKIAFDNARASGYDPIQVLARTDALNSAVDNTGTISMENAVARLEAELRPIESGVYDTLKAEGTTITPTQFREGMMNILQSSRLQLDERSALVRKIEKLSAIVEDVASKNNGQIPLWMLQARKTSLGTQIRTQYGTVKGSVNKEVVRAYKEMIETYAKNIDVKKYNELLSQLYAYRGILKALHGKKVEGGRLGRYASMLVGSYVGGQIGGAPGAIVGGEIGYRMRGKQLQKAFGGSMNAPLLTNKEKAFLQSSKSVGKRNISQAKTKTVTKTDIGKSIPQKKGVVTKAKEAVSELNKTAKKNLKGPGSQAGFAKIGKGESPRAKAERTTLERVSSSPNDTTVRVGLSPVKGTIAGKYDDLVTKADALFAEGKYDEATKVYTQIAQGAQKTVQDRFKRTNIKLKFNSVGFGVYEGVPEPNIDFSAVVKPEDMDLFHNILSDLSQKDFNQHSFVTYKQTPLKRDVPYGITNKEKGISEEPHFTFQSEKPLTLADVKMVNEALADAELQAMSIKEGGKRIDVLNLTGYNSDYEVFINKVHDFKKNLDSKGIAGTSQFARAEVRFVGDKGSSANATYERSRGAFYKENKAFIKPDDIESKVLDAIRYKPTISKKELESIVNSGEVSPTEKAVFRDVLSEMRDGQMKAVEVQSRLRGKLLSINPTESTSYTNYGWDNVYRDYDGKSVVFDSNFKHGKGTSHFQAEGLFGHARYAITIEPKATSKGFTKEGGRKIATIGELQSDVFQHTNNIDHIKNFLTDEIQSANNDVVKWSRIVSENPSDAVAKERLRVIEQSRNKLLDIQAEKTPDALKEQFLNFARSNQYRQRLFEETVDYIMKTDKPDEIRIAKPSMVAKIEGYMGSGDDIAPYENLNGGFGRGADDLTYGDEVGYLGEPYTVVDVQAQGRGWGGPPPTMIGIVPEDKVSKFRLSDHIDGEVNYRMEELESILKDNGVEKESDLLTEEILQRVSDDAPWPVSNMADQYLSNYDNPDRKVFNKANFIEDTEELAREKIEENVWSDLEDIYGKDHVFSDEGSGYDPMVYVVQDDVEVEYHGQPSSYTMDRNPLDLDESPSVMREMLPEYEGILTGYFDLHNKIIPKYEQKIGQQFTDGVMETPDYTAELLFEELGEMGYATFNPDYSRQSPPKKTF